MLRHCGLRTNCDLLGSGHRLTYAVQLPARRLPGDIMPMIEAEMRHAVQSAEAERAAKVNKSGTGSGAKCSAPMATLNTATNHYHTYRLAHGYVPAVTEK